MNEAMCWNWMVLEPYLDDNMARPYRSVIALGHAAVEAGFRVRYFAAASLAETLYRGLADNSVGRLTEGLLRADLVILDDLGFAPLDDTWPSSGSGSSPRPTSAGAWASRPTGRSSPGAASCPSTRQRSPCSTGSCTTQSRSSRRATPTG
jgi:IstB-like ATP binding protein